MHRSNRSRDFRLKTYCSKRPVIDEPNCEGASRQSATESIGELQRCASLECCRCRVPINLAHVWRCVGSNVGRSWFRNHSTVTVEAQTQRYLRAGSGNVFLGWNPACPQCSKHVADRIQVAWDSAGGVPLGRRIRCTAVRPAFNGQL